MTELGYLPDVAQSVHDFANFVAAFALSALFVRWN